MDTIMKSTAETPSDVSEQSNTDAFNNEVLARSYAARMSSRLKIAKERSDQREANLRLTARDRERVFCFTR